MQMIITPEAFAARLREVTTNLSHARSVTGPGRSGAIASVYASHLLRIPWLPFGELCPPHLRPLLIIDTARKHGRTLRRAAAKYGSDVVICAVFEEPPRVKFWYENLK